MLALMVILPVANAESTCVARYPSPSQYTGKCVNGLADGYGEARHTKAFMSYKGQFKGGFPHGHGTWITNKKGGGKTVMSGQWAKGKLHGKGTIKFADGTYYQGSVNMDKYHGYGVYKDSNGVYKGNFVNGLKHGKGHMTYTSGNQYSGGWVRGLKSGYGVYKLSSSGGSYKGTYYKGERHGAGQLQLSNGKSIRGIWTRGKVTGGDAFKYINAPISTPQPQNKVGSGAAIYGAPDVIESRIDGDFEGWEGETIFKLMNGQIWQQVDYKYTYHYAYMPEVIIIKSVSGYKMKVEGVRGTIQVVRLK